MEVFLLYCCLASLQTCAICGMIIYHHSLMGAEAYCFSQVGDFYEALGIDACVLVEYAGLNPFGGLRSDSVPRAGCPVVVIELISL